MDEEIKKRRCKSCKKLLLDEKLPFCKRCTLEGRNKAGQFVGAITAVGGLLILPAVARVNNDSNNNEPD